jgi:hypothetical protein
MQRKKSGRRLENRSLRVLQPTSEPRWVTNKSQAVAPLVLTVDRMFIFLLHNYSGIDTATSHERGAPAGAAPDIRHTRN